MSLRYFHITGKCTTLDGRYRVGVIANMKEDTNMAEFPYSTNPAQVGPLLEQIRKIGVPPIVDSTLFDSMGLNSGQSRIVRILTLLGFVDDARVPTERWRQHRDSKKGPLVLADAVREAYAPLYQMYPDAHLQDDATLQRYFASQTSLAESTVKLVVRTFRVLCGVADFAPLPPSESGTASGSSSDIEHVVSTTLPTEDAILRTTMRKDGITVNVNIQLTLPDTKDETLYDRFFESLRKHLLD